MCLNIWRCCVHICVCSNNFHLFTVILHWNHTYTLYSANGFEYGPRKPYSYQNHLTEWIVGRTKKTVCFTFCPLLLRFLLAFICSAAATTTINTIQKLFNSKRSSMYLRSMVLLLVFVFGHFDIRSSILLLSFFSLIFRYVFEHSLTGPFVLHIQNYLMPARNIMTFSHLNFAQAVEATLRRLINWVSFFMSSWFNVPRAELESFMEIHYPSKSLFRLHLHFHSTRRTGKPQNMN